MNKSYSVYDTRCAQKVRAANRRTESGKIRRRVKRRAEKSMEQKRVWAATLTWGQRVLDASSLSGEIRHYSRNQGRCYRRVRCGCGEKDCRECHHPNRAVEAQAKQDSADAADGVYEGWFDL